MATSPRVACAGASSSPRKLPDAGCRKPDTPRREPQLRPTRLRRLLSATSPRGADTLLDPSAPVAPGPSGQEGATPCQTLPRARAPSRVLGRAGVYDPLTPSPRPSPARGAPGALGPALGPAAAAAPG